MTDPQPAGIGVPRTESGRRELLVRKPPIWEYLYLGACLTVGMDEREEQWRDFSLGYTMTIGPKVNAQEFSAYDFAGRMIAIVERLVTIMARPAQEVAFGLPGQPGNADMVQHLGKRFTASYGQLLDWATELRSLRIESHHRDLELARQTMVEMGAPSIQACREFVSRYIADVERWSADIAAGNPWEGEFVFALVMEVPDPLVKRYVKHIRKALKA
jgi:hypothetical protein